MRLLLALTLLVLAGCTPFVDVMDVKAIPPETLARSNSVRVYQLGSNQQAPTVLKDLGQIEAYSCKHWMTDPPASKGNALQQLKVKAAQLGANAVIDVTFDSDGTDAWGTNCWQSVQASGMAVKTK